MTDTKYFLIVAKLCVQACLFSTFLLLFAIPDITRFNLKEVMVVELVRKTKGMKAPSVTIVGRNNPNLAWKNSGSNLDEVCENYPENQTERCIEENALDQSDVVKDILIGDRIAEKGVLEKKAEYNISHVGSLRPYFSRTMYGISYTFENSLEVSLKERITLCLSFNKSYSIFIHDKEFFLLNNVPSLSGEVTKTKTNTNTKCCIVLIHIGISIMILHSDRIHCLSF